MNSPRPLSTGLILFGVIAVVASAGFVRLGIWQMARHREVRDDSAARAARIALDPVPLSSLMSQANHLDSLLGRRVEVAGVWDFDHEVVIRSRARSGTPGIHVVTPLRLVSDTGDEPVGGMSMLVLRGWLPSPNPATAQLTAARTNATIPATGPGLALVRASRSGHGEPMIELTGGDDHIASYAAIDVELIAAERPGTLPFFLQLLPDASGKSGQPGDPYRVPLPALDNGPHLLYMIQWYSFALITIVGATVFIRRESRRRKRPVPVS